MKVLLCALGFLLLVGQISCLPDWIKYAEECKKDFPNIGDGNKKDPNDPTVKCFMACISEKKGVLKPDGKIDEEKFLEAYKNMYETDDSFDDKVKGCAKQGNEESDKCDVIAKAGKCVRDEYGPPTKH